MKSKDVSKVESTPLKISIVTHEPLWRPLWRVRDLIKLHCLAELAFLNLHCRLVDTIGEGLRGSTVDGHQTMPLFLRICIVPCSSCICFKVIRKKNEDERFDFDGDFSIPRFFAYLKGVRKEDEARIIRFRSRFSIRNVTKDANAMHLQISYLALVRQSSK